MKEMYPPNGGQQPSKVQDCKVDECLANGWTLAPYMPTTPQPTRRIIKKEAAGETK